MFAKDFNPCIRKRGSARFGRDFKQLKLETPVYEERSSIFFVHQILGELRVEPGCKVKGYPMEILSRIQQAPQSFLFIAKA